MNTKKAAVKRTLKPTAKPAVKTIEGRPAAKSVATKKPATVVAAAKTIAPVATSAASKIAPKVAAKPAVKPAPLAKRAAAKSPAKAASPIVRDSFTMTAADQELLKKCKRDAVTSGRDSTKKSEIVRAALRHFASLAASTQLMELNGLDTVKTGRPKKK